MRAQGKPRHHLLQRLWWQVVILAGCQVSTLLSLEYQYTTTETKTFQVKENPVDHNQCCGFGWFLVLCIRIHLFFLLIGSGSQKNAFQDPATTNRGKLSEISLFLLITYFSKLSWQKGRFEALEKTVKTFFYSFMTSDTDDFYFSLWPGSGTVLFPMVGSATPMLPTITLSGTATPLE